MLEIGIGPGFNLPLYSEAVENVIGLDSSAQLLTQARSQIVRRSLLVDLMLADAEAIPIESHTIDSVVTTWTLCSVRDVESSLCEIRRVLKSNGRLVFVKHGPSPERYIRWLQDRLTPIWSHISGGCHLDRAVIEMIVRAGFRMSGPKLMTFMYEGVARPY